jgi:transcription-repair coupling factor (superfamily II helicase)
MGLTGLLPIIRQLTDFQEVFASHREGVREQLVSGIGASMKTAFLAAMFQEKPEHTLLITHSPLQAVRLVEDLESILGEGRIFLYPTEELLPHEQVRPNWDLVGKRLSALRAMMASEPAIIVAPGRAIVERVLSPQELKQYYLTFKIGQELDLDDLAGHLISSGYLRVDLVEGRGQFSVRGGIMDIFPPDKEYPLRLELFDTELDSLREFDPNSQRSRQNLREVEICPAWELPYPRELSSEKLQAIEESAKKVRGLDRDAKELLRERTEEHLEKLRGGSYFPGIALYAPAIVPLTDFLSYFQGRLVVLDEPNRIREGLLAFEYEFSEQYTSKLAKGLTLPLEREFFLSWEELFKSLKEFQLLYFSLLGKRMSGMRLGKTSVLGSRSQEQYHGKLEELARSIGEWQQDKYRILFVVGDIERARRLADGLAEFELPTVVEPELLDPPPASVPVATVGSLEAGWELPTAKLVVLTENELFGRERKKRRVRIREKGIEIASFQDLQIGDYVVHVNHGIGQYRGVETLKIDGKHKDYLLIKYLGEDRLYVPVDQIGLLQKYVGVEEAAPKLNKLNGTDWNRAKSKVRDSVQKMAIDLLELYAQRESIRGHAFSPDTVWQKDFEEAFPYEETPDQLRAIEDIKKDMEKTRPMDRLLCGDVGYGKTEVALRGAFKSVMEGKQVAVLVPTTILAQQHYNTFRERFAGYPVKVAALSRFQTAREQKKVLRELRGGQVDIVIGTHRLLGKDVEFRDLGLMVIDEEQRFGVGQKEALKEMRSTVDVLTMTATPIPRTLHMAMVGVRDMSVIETPPEDRYPVRTYVIEFHPQVIREAIGRELGRGGQVFFVYNKVHAISSMAAYLQGLVPEARISIAHGQMPEGELEEVMMGFLEGEADILLCTTIIETGLDIPNVNTLIVHDADRFGLAQLYQLRGRVGRSSRIAYAYFTYQKDKALSEEAEKRLVAIREFTELGSGFKIAMRDLEIRGAGNILGPEQHGFISTIGFELYCKMLEEAVAQLRGQKVELEPEPVIELDLEAYIADDYVPDSKQKLSIYKRLAAMREASEVDELADELLDRYGEWPESVVNLLKVARIKALAKKIGIEGITSDQYHLVVRFHQEAKIDPGKLVELVQKRRYPVSLVAGSTPQLKVRKGRTPLTALLGQLENILGEIAGEKVKDE